MTKDQAEKAGVENHRLFFNVANGKANLAPPPDKADWYRLIGVPLGNGGANPFDQGDTIGVVVQWEWPDALAEITVEHLRKAQAAVAAGRWRENHQAKDWVGKAIGQALGLDVSNKGEKTKVLGMLKTWLGTGMFVTVEGEDDKRMKRTFVEVGEAATD